MTAPEPDSASSGIQQRLALSVPGSTFTSIEWSPDGNLIAACSRDGAVRIWHAQTGSLLHTLPPSDPTASIMGWSASGAFLAVAGDQAVHVWDAPKFIAMRPLNTGLLFAMCRTLAWCPVDDTLAVSFGNGAVKLFDGKSGRTLRPANGIPGNVGVAKDIVWARNGKNLIILGLYGGLWHWDRRNRASRFREFSPGLRGPKNRLASSIDGQILALGFADSTISIFRGGLEYHVGVLEGHTSPVSQLSISHDAMFLVSGAEDGTVLLWRTYSWEAVGILRSQSKYSGYIDRDGISSRLKFHPHSLAFATINSDGSHIRIWDIDAPTLYTAPSVLPSVHYVNAKVVLVGDSGVGKSGLSLVLTDHRFEPTESTHGRHVWPLDRSVVASDIGSREVRETLLWDLAGQPGYRLIHQLHLNDVAVAAIVFDARSETDPFAGVRHWDRALRQAERLRGDQVPKIARLLVAARIDRGGVALSRERVTALQRELKCTRFIETSSKEGVNILTLRSAIMQAIPWNRLPRVTSTSLFMRIREFIIEEKESDRILSTTEDLYRAFLRAEGFASEPSGLRSQFVTCTGRLESQGLIQRLSFGDLVLLQPEVIDAYAAALINAVKSEPDGLGDILEDRVKSGGFAIPLEQKLDNTEQEHLLLIAMVEDLIRHEIAFRESGSEGSYLVFPSQSTRDNPEIPDPSGKLVAFEFEGATLNIYATLAVRLSHSGMFRKEDLWKNAASYRSLRGHVYGMFLREVEEGRGEIVLFAPGESNEDERFYFEQFVLQHLDRRALPGTIQQKRFLVCQTCRTPFTEQQVAARKLRGFSTIRCSVCDVELPLQAAQPTVADDEQERVADMDRQADLLRDLQASVSVLEGKKETRDFDVFLCHNGEDKPEVKIIAEALKSRGILPWLDEWELRPGFPWQRELEEQIGKIKSAAIFVGKNGVGPWQQNELEGFIRQFVNRRCPVIPVLLGSSPLEPDLPIFLEGFTWVDFRKSEADPLQRLIWGITGSKEPR